MVTKVLYRAYTIRPKRTPAYQRMELAVNILQERILGNAVEKRI